MKFLIVAGHEGTTGAVSGKLIEEVLTKILADKIVAILKKQGHEAVEPEFNLYDEVNKKSFPDYLKQFNYVLEVHFNFYNGSAWGTEIFVDKSVTKIGVEKAIMKRMKKWFRLRDDDKVFDGVRVGPFKTISHLKSKGALLEVCFIDNKAEMEIFLKNTDAIAEDIAFGIMEGFELPIKPAIIPKPPVTPKPPVVEPPKNQDVKEDLAPEGKLFQVAIGAYKKRTNATDEFNKAKSAGLDPYLVLIDDPRGIK